MKKSILIVDDDKVVLKSLKEILQLGGYCVDMAQTGREAIEKSKEKPFNLALLDIKLPDMEGTELLNRMYETTPRMIKIMVTGSPSLENSVRSLNLGADAYLMKPVTGEELLKVASEKLKEQEKTEQMTERKVTKWIRTRGKKAGLES